MSKRVSIIILFLCLTLIAACSNSQNQESAPAASATSTPDAALVAENKELKEKVAALTQELEALKNEPRDLLKAAQGYAKDLPSLAKDKINTLLEKYPDAPEAATAKELLATIDAQEKEQDAAMEAAATKKKADAEKAKADEEKRLKSALANVRKKTDDIQDIDYYYAKTTTSYVNENEAFIYIIKDKNTIPFLRFKIQYAGDDWLFINKYTIKTDSDTYNISPGYANVERDNNGSGVWEWYDYALSSYDFDMLHAIASSKKAVIRYEGDQYHKDRTLTSEEKKAIQTVLDAYKALGGI